MPASDPPIAATEAELQALYAASSDALARLGRDGRIQRWSRAAESLYGYTEQDVTGRPITLVEACARGELDAAIATLTPGSLVRFVTEHLHRRGRRLDVEVTLAPFRGVPQRAESIVMVARDLGPVRNLERELARVSQAVELTCDALLSVDLEGRLRHWSAGAERLFGISADEVIGCGAIELDAVLGEPVAREQRWARTFAEVAEHEATAQLVVRRRRGDGRTADLLVRLAPWRIAGAVVGVTALIIDITAQRSAGTELTRSA